MKAVINHAGSRINYFGLGVLGKDAGDNKAGHNKSKTKEYGHAKQ